MLKAAEFMQDGSLIYRAAQLQAQDMHYQLAIKIWSWPLKGLNEKDRAQAIMLAASSAYELNDLRSARRYFQNTGSRQHGGQCQILAGLFKQHGRISKRCGRGLIMSFLKYFYSLALKCCSRHPSRGRT